VAGPPLWYTTPPMQLVLRLLYCLVCSLVLLACASAPDPTTSTATAAAALAATTEQRAQAQASTAEREAQFTRQTAETQQAQATIAAARTSTAERSAQTATATAEIAALYPAGREVFRDEFVDNRNFWFTGVFQEIETDLIEDGVFKVRWAGKGTSYELWESQELSDFAAEVECRVLAKAGDGSCALIFGQANEVGFYKFEVFADYYRLAVIADGSEPLILAEGRPAPGFEVSEPFSLRVVRRNSAIRIALDDQPLASINDDTFVSGKVGVSTSSYSEAGEVEVHFDNFTIWTLSDE
jgi:hypothetical protein